MKILYSTNNPNITIFLTIISSMEKSYIIQLVESRNRVIHKLYININKKKRLIDSKSVSDYSMRSDSDPPPTRSQTF